MSPSNGERIEEDEALLEAFAVHDEALKMDGVSDPEERMQIIYLSYLLSIVEERAPEQT